MDTTAGLAVTVPFLSTAVPVIGVVHAAFAVKVAVTEEAAAIELTVQVDPDAVQPPLHDAKVEPGVAFAVSTTSVPYPNDAEQVAPHEMPAGELVTVPVPAPTLLTVTA